MTPTLLFDGDCFFCRRWIHRWQQQVGSSVNFKEFQKTPELASRIKSEKLSSVYYFDEREEPRLGAEAVFTTLAHVPSKKWVLSLYQAFAPFRIVSEWFYRLVANNRVFFSKMTRLLWGNVLAAPTYRFSSWLFTKALGFIYLIAFVSFGVQMKGLIGESGISPAGQFMKLVKERFGLEAYSMLPTLAWFNSSDVFLSALMIMGSVAAVLLVLGWLPKVMVLICWVAYLSIVNIGQDFMSFQWDILLLEVGFLAIFLTPMKTRLGGASKMPIKGVETWLYQWLLFRLMFRSGWVKLASQDTAWWNLEALNVHYETQPLPTWVSWYAHQLPEWFQKISVFNMFVIELVIPFFFFLPRRLRLIACSLTVFLQVLIYSTGNYNFFNLLTMVLCLFLIADSDWLQLPKIKHIFKDKTLELNRVAKPLYSRIISGVLALVLVVASIPQVWGMVPSLGNPPKVALAVRDAVRPFRVVNGYGLFANMTEVRPEIVLEGSDNAKDWKPYEFKWKPGDPSRAPGMVAPHQPRLDWQMWFAALRPYQQTPWFLNFMAQVLRGEEDVLRLMGYNPFPEAPPRYMRAVLYLYEFSDFAEKKEQGIWWKRVKKGLYCPVMVRQGDKVSFLRLS